MYKYFLLLTSLISIYSLIKKLIKIRQAAAGTNSQGGANSYAQKGDPEAQRAYLEKKRTSKMRLSLAEKHEQEWSFLYEIAQQVESKLSLDEKDLLKEIGTNLYTSGMRYQHDLELAVDIKPKT